jgi:hypothetical protein
MTTLVPSTDYRYALKRGMSGTDVAALQINFKDLVVDGDFGEQTEFAVKEFQAKHNLLDDGIAGSRTQQKLVVQRSEKAHEAYPELPKGFLKSVAQGESNFIVSAVSKHPSDAGIDVGPFQLSTGKTLGSQEFYHLAYNARASALEAAREAKEFAETLADPVPSKYFNDLANGDEDKFKIQMTVLSHNWPDAAEDIPRYGVIYEFDQGKDDEPQEWIIEASAGRLQTPRQWVHSYIERNTVYIRW